LPILTNFVNHYSVISASSVASESAFSIANFIQRKATHKSCCNNIYSDMYNLKLYQMIRENGGWNNFTMIPLEEYPCENFIQACIKEEEYRVELQSQLNMKKCFVAETKEEYRKIYRSSPSFVKKQYPEYDKEYRETHKEQIAERNKIYNETHKEENAKRHKIYYETNKEEKKEENAKRHKEWYEKNKEREKEKARLKYAQKKLVQTEN
jgi:hypothetical protein